MIIHIAIAWFMSVKEFFKIEGENSIADSITVGVAIVWMSLEFFDIFV
jgi:hypothetical protein